MSERTEDLLCVRDGEPIDATIRERILADPLSRRQLERLRALRSALGRLPSMAPPERCWHRLRADLDRRTGIHDPRRILAQTRWAQIVGVAVLALLGGLAAIVIGRYDAGEASEAHSDYTPLVQESLRLERLLTRIPQDRRVVGVGTAGTIIGLEDQIASIDAELSIGAAAGLDSRYRVALWQERVDLMSALVYVRYAEAQKSVF